MHRFVFDLDNTLIFTDSLNNESYNYSLKLNGLAPIIDCKRITRATVFNKYFNLTDLQKTEIVRLKQEYFLNNLKNTEPNIELFKVLATQKPESCLLWTSADENRVKTILDYHNICNSFGKILFSRKIILEQDIENICDLLDCDLEQLVFYEDNKRVISELQLLKLNVIAI